MQVDTSDVNGETDPDPRSAIVVPRNSQIDEDSFNKERLEKYLDTNVKNGDWLCDWLRRQTWNCTEWVVLCRQHQRVSALGGLFDRQRDAAGCLQ